jgi:hypothetical protein
MESPMGAHGKTCWLPINFIYVKKERQNLLIYGPPLDSIFYGSRWKWIRLNINTKDTKKQVADWISKV